MVTWRGGSGDGQACDRRPAPRRGGRRSSPRCRVAAVAAAPRRAAGRDVLDAWTRRPRSPGGPAARSRRDTGTPAPSSRKVHLNSPPRAVLSPVARFRVTADDRRPSLRVTWKRAGSTGGGVDRRSAHERRHVGDGEHHEQHQHRAAERGVPPALRSDRRARSAACSARCTPCATVLIASPIAGPTPRAIPSAGRTNGNTMYISRQRTVATASDVWNARRASAWLARGASGGSRSRRRMN